VSKKTVFSSMAIVLAVALVLSGVAGCARPKPESRMTPTAEVFLPTTTATLEADTTAIPEPTIITTSPNGASEQPEESAAEPGAEATPTPVVISPSTATTEPASTGTGEESADWVLYTVQTGDTLYSIAARYGSSVDAIVSLNGIARPDQIQAGVQIKIPKAGASVPSTSTEGATEYIVRAGDNLQGIASRYGVTVDAIVRANGLANSNFIYAGQKLIIPVGESQQTETTPSSSTGGRVHVVKAGESIDMIASMYGTTRQAIVSANNLANPNWIHVGQELIIP